MNNLMNRPSLLILLTLSLLSVAVPAAEPAFDAATPFRVGNYGDDHAVKLLAGLLDDPDPLTRVTAARDLGETDNPAALTPLQRAVRDADPAVRATAVSAAAKLNKPGSPDLAVSALADDDATVVLRALGALRQLAPGDIPEAVVPLLTHQNAAVRASALQTFTTLGFSAGKLPELLADPAADVRLRALENALLLSNGAPLAGAVTAAADASQPPAIQAVAIEWLGKFAYAESKDRINAASKDKNVLVRRGAVRAYAHAKASDEVARMLSDASPIVRLAVIQAAGKLKLTASVDRLTQLMLDAPDDATHTAARDALLTIGTDKVAEQAAQALPALLDALTPVDGNGDGKKRSARGMQQINRNAVTCCDILGRVFAGRGKQAAGLPGTDTMLAIVRQLNVSQLPVGAAAQALGAIGDARAIEPLRATMETCLKNGRAALIAAMRQSSGPPYDGQVAGQVARGLAALNDAAAVPTMIGILKVNVQDTRLVMASRHVLDVLPTFAESDHADAIANAVLTVIKESGSFGTAVAPHAARAAVGLKLQDAVEPLREFLKQREGGRDVLNIAAWAVSQLTGKETAAPAPLPRPGDWIIRPAK